MKLRRPLCSLGLFQLRGNPSHLGTLVSPSFDSYHMSSWRPPAYTGESNLEGHLRANEASKVKLDHLVKPGVERGSNPYHYLIVRVDGERLNMEVVGVDWGAGFQPYRSNKVSLEDQ